MSESRKLAAILAADVVGYSRLAGADEDRILARLRALRSDLIDPTIAVHHGRVVKRTGDGALVEFRSVVDAVRCAIEVQNAMLERNAGVPPDRRIEFRIGIHIGDVVEESDGDLMGDGVNIAARLEGVAAPGAICLSEDAYRQVRARLDLSVSDLGQTQLKNIAEPMRVYSLQVGVSAKAGHRSHPGCTRPACRPARPPTELPDKPSIAVLPFTNMSGDPEQEYFSDGITEDIITDLSKIAGLMVVARNSSFAYKNKSPDVRIVGRELGVASVLEGSIRRAGNRVRITAQLIDAATGGHLWAERYDRDLTDIFELQDEVTLQIVEALKVKLRPAKRHFWPTAVPAMSKRMTVSCAGASCCSDQTTIARSSIGWSRFSGVRSSSILTSRSPMPVSAWPIASTSRTIGPTCLTHLILPLTSPRRRSKKDPTNPMRIMSPLSSNSGNATLRQRKPRQKKRWRLTRTTPLLTGRVA